jgi:hypothetical protein
LRAPYTRQFATGVERQVRQNVTATDESVPYLIGSEPGTYELKLDQIRDAWYEGASTATAEGNVSEFKGVVSSTSDSAENYKPTTKESLGWNEKKQPIIRKSYSTYLTVTFTAR